VNLSLGGGCTHRQDDIMEIEVESSVTLHIHGDHFIKERRRLLADVDVYGAVPNGLPNYEKLEIIFQDMFEAISKSLWEGIIDNMDVLENTSG